MYCAICNMRGLSKSVKEGGKGGVLYLANELWRMHVAHLTEERQNQEPRLGKEYSQPNVQHR